MKQQITICEALTCQEVQDFWKELHTYHKRDIFPEPGDEDLAYFLSDEYHSQIQSVHDRPLDRCYYLFFCRGGQRIGFALPALYPSEDGKCFLLEFCVFPEFRGNGTGHACAQALLAWAKARGACYAELNYGGAERRFRFWRSLGFRPNGVDEWGEPLMLLPPEKERPVVVEPLTEPEDWQLLKLENGYLTEVGEEILSEEKQKALQKAVREGRITFFMARRDGRAVGMCSVTTAFSTFACADIGFFEDFYIEPVFRGKGIARLLANAAQRWCREHGISSLTVCCAPCDEERYRSLGFEAQLGKSFAYLP